MSRRNEFDGGDQKSHVSTKSGSAQAWHRVVAAAIAPVAELLENRQLLSTTSINSNDAVPFQHVVIDSNPGTTPVAKIWADLNGDGKLDAVIGHESTLGGGGIYWYQFPASGNAADPWTKYTIDPTADVYEAIRPYDVNHDGAMDLIVAERGTLYWYENPMGSGGNVHGTWTKHLIGNSPGQTHEQTILTDIDGDGKMDIISNDVIFFQNSPTSWTTVAAPEFNRTEKGLSSFDSGSGLGAIDLAGTGNAPGFQPGWFQNPRDIGGNARTGIWQFFPIGPAYSGYTAGSGISYAATDINGDGRMDILTAFGEANTFLPGGLIWWEAPANRATGTWIEHTIDPTIQYVHNIVLGDMNGDGQMDILAFEQDQSAQQRLMIVYNEGGTGQNWLEQTLATTGGQNEDVGDATGDGDLDIVTARHGFFNQVNPIEVFMNELAPDGIVAPVVTTPPASQSAATGSNVTFKVTATGTGPLTYQWQLNGLDISGANSSSFTVSNVQTSQSGSVYRVIVGNPHGLIPSSGATLTVSSDPGPTVSAGSNKSVNFPLPVTLSGSVTQNPLPQGATLTSTWSAISGPGAVTFANVSNPSTTATFSAVGSYVLQLSGSDGTVTHTSQVTITVNPDPGPTVSAGTGQSITLPFNSVQLSGSATENPLPPGHTLSTTWSQISGPPSISFSDVTSLVTTATFSAPGSYLLELTGSDGITSNVSTLTINVGADAGPTVSAGPNQTITLPTNSVPLSGSVTQSPLPQGVSLTSFWSQISGPGSTTFADAGSASTSTDFPSAGTYVLQLSGSDGTTSNSSQVTIVVNPPGPVVTAGSNQTVTLPNTASLNGSVAETNLPLGGSLSSTWSQISGPGTTTFANANSAVTTASFDMAGAYTLQLVGSDGVYTNAAQANIQVNADPGPVVSAGANQAISIPANSLALNGSVSETPLPLGRSLTSTWSQVSGPAGVSFVDATNPTTTATFPGVGTYVLQLSGSDGITANTSQVTLTVNPDPGPAVSAGSNQTITLPSSAALSGSVSENPLPQGLSLTSTWSLFSGPATVSFANAASPVTTATFSLAGTYVLQLSGADGITANTSKVTITVNPVSTYSGTPFPGPSAAAVPGTIQAENFDNGGQGVAYNWQTTTNPGGVNYRSGTGVGIQSTSDTGGGDNICYAVTGDWLKYTVNAATSGTYSLDFRVAQKAAGGQMHVEVDGANVTGVVNVPNTGSWTTWQTITVTGINLTAGKHLVKVSFDTNANDNPGQANQQFVANLNWFRFNLTQAAPQGPTVSAGSNQSVNYPFPVTLSGSVTESNPPGTLTSTWTLVSGPGNVTFTNANSASTGATFSTSGSYLLQLAGSDGTITNTAQVTITVNPDPGPTVSAGSTQTITLPSTASLSGSVSQSPLPAGATLTSTWSFKSGPGTVSFANPASLATTASFSQSGTYVLQLAGSDGITTNTSTVTLTVNPAPVPGPVVSAGANQTVNYPNGVSLSGSVVEQGATLTSTWTQSGGAGTVTFANSGNPLTTATFSQPGTYTLQLSGSDGTFTHVSSVTITVNPDPGPTVSAGANQTITLPSSAALSGSVTQTPLPQGLSLSSTWSQISGPGTASFANPSSAATTAGFSLAGTYVLQLSGTDGITTHTSQVTITVNPVSTYSGTPFPGPSAAAVPGTIQAENFDNGGQGVAYNWQTATNPGGVNYRPGTGVGIQSTSDTGGGDNICYAVAGDWLDYTINAATTRTYSLQLRVAQKAAGGQMHVEVDGVNVTGTIAVPNTGGWQNWQTITVTGINLTAGKHLVKVSFDTNANDNPGIANQQFVANLNWLQFV